MAADFPEAKVLLHTATYRPYILNESAAAIWDFCKTPKDIDSVVKYLNRTYGVKAARAKRDVERAVSSMRKKKVIKVYERKDKV